MNASLIRTATPADAAGIAAVHVETWRSTYPGILPDRYLVGLSVQEHTKRWRGLLASPAPRGRRTFIAHSNGAVIGFASCGPQRTGLQGYVGEFYAVYLLDQRQGQGIGRRMLAAMAQELLGQGVRSALVWVLRDNPSRFFYERLGGTLLAEQPINFAGSRLCELAYGWSDLLPLARMPVDPPVGR